MFQCILLLPDIDECTAEGTCSQFCENTVPGYKCTCVEGYRLGTDKRKCKATGKKSYNNHKNSEERLIKLNKKLNFLLKPIVLKKVTSLKCMFMENYTI